MILILGFFYPNMNVLFYPYFTLYCLEYGLQGVYIDKLYLHQFTAIILV